MRIIFINYHKLVDSSGIHIFQLANQFEALGVRCTVCIPAPQDNEKIFGTFKFDLVQYTSLDRLPFSDRIRLGSEEPILHAWTPRENVRQLTLRLSRSLITRYYVHMEDNEEFILGSELNAPFSKIETFPSLYLSERLREDSINPKKYKSFLRNAAGVTCIIDTLEEFVPNNVPKLTFWPSCESEFYDLPMTPKRDLCRQNGLTDDVILIGYTGNMHLSNANELTKLYEAIGALNEQGYPVTLLRSGTNSCAFSSDVSSIRAKHVVEFGSISSAEIREIIANADILVQPGEDNNFNRYRFPSKLPMYLASGRPVILPRTNLGRHLDDGHNCLLLTESSTSELIDKIKKLITNPELRYQVGAAGRGYAREHFSWETSAKSLLAFYARTDQG